MVTVLKSLENWNRPLFIIAGGIILIFAVFVGVIAFTDISRDMLTTAAIFDSAGRGVALLGALGLTLLLDKSNRWLTRIAALFAGLGVVGSLVFSIGATLEAASLIPGPPELLLAIIPPLMGLGMLSLLLFGVSVLRSDVLSRETGILLIAPLFIFIGMFVSGFDPAWVGSILALAQSMVLFGIGLSLPAEDTTLQSKPSQQVSSAL